jgi:proteasome alpha subunit
VADARQLIDFARREAQINRLRFGEAVGVETLTKTVTDYIQQYTQVGGARPFGVALIVGGIDDGTPRLYETDPSGTPDEREALAVGADRGEIQDYLEENYDPDATLEEGIDLALGALASVNDDALSPEGVGVSTVDAETATFGEHDDDEIEERLDDLGVLATEDESEPDADGDDS